MRRQEKEREGNRKKTKAIETTRNGKNAYVVINEINKIICSRKHYSHAKCSLVKITLSRYLALFLSLSLCVTIHFR